MTTEVYQDDLVAFVVDLAHSSSNRRTAYQGMDVRPGTWKKKGLCSEFPHSSYNNIIINSYIMCTCIILRVPTSGGNFFFVSQDPRNKIIATRYV